MSLITSCLTKGTSQIITGMVEKIKKSNISANDLGKDSSKSLQRLSGVACS